MDNFRRRAAKKDRKITSTEYYPTGLVVNSWNPPSERTYQFGSGEHYVAEENITVYYDVYYSYDDGTLEHVRSTSWTGNIYPVIITRTSSFVGQYTYDAASAAHDGNYFWVLINNNGNQILKSDADGTLVQYELEMLLNRRPDTYDWSVYDRLTFGKVVLTKKGASGSGNVLARFESYV